MNAARAASSEEPSRRPRRWSPRTRSRAAANGGAAFGRPFWFTYAANTLMMMAISLLFRYADFVRLLGGDEFQLGWIVGAGMVGSLLVRIAQGVGIDRYGARVIWMWSSVGYVVACLLHLGIGSLDGPAIYAVRMLYQTSVAGFFGASITFISGRAPIARLAEVVGTLGTSGFVGMIAGTNLSDALLRAGATDRTAVNRMFLAAAALGALGLVCSWLATQGADPPRARRQPSLVGLLRRYHPGAVLLVGVALGFGIGLPQVFLRPYTESLGIPGIALFFGLYPPLAFVTRLAIRRLPELWGVRRMILIGLAALVGAMLLFLPVRTEWHLVAPAVLLGVAHACLFPSVVAGGSGGFPARFRGLGTTLILATVDLGTLIGAPTVGTTIRVANTLGLPRYPTTFLVVSGLLTLVAVVYAVASRHDVPPDQAVARAAPPLGIEGEV